MRSRFMETMTQLTSDAETDSLLERSLLFQRWQVMKKEILLHKWYQSEKAGYDVGFERAATNWMIHHAPRGHGANPSRQA